MTAVAPFGCSSCGATRCMLHVRRAGPYGTETYGAKRLLCTQCLNKADGNGPRRVTVCSACLKASCWQGTWPCEKARGAGTVAKTVGELRELALESESYWCLPRKDPR